MIRPARALGVVAAALSVSTVLAVYIAMGERATFGYFAEGLLLAGVQALVPCLMFFAGVKVLLRHLSQQRRSVQTLPAHLVIALTLALVMLAAVNLFDWLDSPKMFQRRGWANVWNYQMYLVFVPLSILLDYSYRRAEIWKRNASSGSDAINVNT